MFKTVVDASKGEFLETIVATFKSLTKGRPP
jgi:hypothetical protein